MPTTQTQIPHLPATKRYRIRIVDDHSVVRRAIRAVLELEPNTEITSETGSGTETIEHVRKHRPDLLLLDLTMPDMNGLEVAAPVRSECPDTQIIILTVHFCKAVAREALKCVALGYMLKSDADTDLIAAVRHVRHNRTYFTGCLANKMIDSFIEDSRATKEAELKGPTEDCPLTECEKEVLRRLVLGESNKKVALTMGVSTRTVESHRNHIMHKMRFTNFSDMVRFAIRQNLIAP
jgi:DNA-binding NarL/FixJ family response regulator